nr:MAG TPA: protein of unknown function DUF859 [Caudoviricetes sp.]
MALSGSVATNAGEYSRYYRLNWTATQSITNNTSTISWTLNAAGGTGWVAERTVYVNIDGASVYSKSNYVERYPGVVASGTKTLTHNSDGTRSFNISIGAAVYYTSVTCTGVGSPTLDTIARASDLSVADGTLGVAQTITADRKSSDFTHTLTWKCGSYSGTIATKSPATSWSFTPELKLAEGAPNGTNVYCEFTLTTNNGNAAIGSTKKSVWLAIPSSVIPTCGMSLSDAKGYKDTYGGYIQGQSILHVVINGSGIFGSSISSYSASANGTRYISQTFDTAPLKTAGSNTITVGVKDSRGRSASASATITVIPYSVPNIVSFSVNRCNADGTENDRGVYAKVTYQYSVTNLSNKNTFTASLNYKKTTDSQWTSVTITPTESIYNVSGSNIIAADDAHSYDISLVVTDSFTSISQSTALSTGYCLYHVRASGKGITWGGVAEDDGFNVKIPAHFHNGLREDITVAESGDCNNLTTGGNYYINSNGANIPVAVNGWLIVKSFGDKSNCYQEFVTCQGERYQRWRTDGTWSAWTRDYGQKLLWEGNSYMGNSQSATLAEDVSSQKNGIVLVFARFVSNTSNPVDEFSCHFVPKMAVSLEGGRGFSFHITDHWNQGVKYLYIQNARIFGNVYNSESKTIGGSTYTNNYYVMRYVIGV